MPRLDYWKDTLTKKAFVTESVDKHGELCTAASARAMLGYKSYPGAYAWLKKAEVPEFNINGRRRWLTKALAEKIWEARTS